MRHILLGIIWRTAGGRSSSSAAAFSHAKLLKRRDVYLKLTRHNGRAGTHGTYNPKHNDRSFNLANSEHIDPERAKSNIYWDCFHGFRSALDPQDPDDLAATFSEVERQFYETHYSAFIEKQNERNAKIRHTERNRSIPDLLSSRKTCPEETIYQRPHTGQAPAGADREDRGKLLFPRPDPGSTPAPTKRKAGGNKNLR